MSISKAFSFVESLIQIPFDFFKDEVFSGKETKESAVGFLGRTLGDAMLATKDEEKPDVKLMDSAKTLGRNMPSTTPSLAQGSPFRFTDNRLATAMRRIVNQSNNQEVLKIVQRANYTPKAIRPSRPTIKQTSTKFG